MSTTAKSNQYFVLNDVAASAADLSTSVGSGGRVLVTGDTEGFLRPKVQSIKAKKFIVETLQTTTVLASAVAAGTTYRFYLKQQLGTEINGVEPLYIDYLAPTGITQAAFQTAITGAVQALINSGKLKATAVESASGNGGVLITALTGYPVIEVGQALNVTAASTLPADTSTGNLSASGTTLTMLQSDTSDFAVGQLVKLTGWTGAAVINGGDSTAGAILRVDSISTNTNVKFVAESVSGSISAAATDYEILASYATGKGSQYIANGIVSGGDPSVDVVSTNVYHEVVVEGGEPSGFDMTLEDIAPFKKTYLINSGDSDALDLVARFVEVANYYVAGGTDVDPALL